MVIVMSKRIVEAIIDDLNDRRGLHIKDLDVDTQKEIRKEWERIVRFILEEE